MRNELKIIGLIMLLLLLSSFYVFSEGEYDWLKDYIVVKESEKATVGADGEPVSINITKKSAVTISQTFNENKKKNKKGVLVVVSRTRETIVEDTNEDITTIKETDFLNGEGMKLTSIVSNKRIPTGRITTTESLNKKGELALTKRVVSSKGQDGVTITTVETPDKEGNLVLRESISSQ